MVQQNLNFRFQCPCYKPGAHAQYTIRWSMLRLGLRASLGPAISLGLPLCSQDSSDHHSAIIFRWQTPKIVCDIDTHLALKGLKNFLCESIRQISLVKIFSQAAQITNLPLLAAGIFPPRSLTRQYDWQTKSRGHKHTPSRELERKNLRKFEYFFECC